MTNLDANSEYDEQGDQPSGQPAAAVTRAPSYGAVAIALHWIIAFAILGQIALGWQLHHIPNGPPRYAAFQVHKSIGITILLLSLARLVWRLARPAPPEDALPHWQRIVSTLVHWGLYTIMIGLPLTGWIMVSSSKLPIPTRLYGIVPWPAIPGLGGLAPSAKAAWNDAADAGHSTLVYVTVAMLVLHLGAVAKHQLVDRDVVFARMAPGARPGWGDARLWIVGVFALIAIWVGHNVLAGAGSESRQEPTSPPTTIATPIVLHPPSAVPTSPATPSAETAVPQAETGPTLWNMQDGQLRFATTWSGTPIAGSFSRWTADIAFSPDRLDQSSLTVRIDLTSASTGDSQRDAALPTADWFDTDAHPSAIFRSKHIRATGGEGFVASGTLDLRGKRQTVAVPFTVKIAKGVATARGAFTVDRTAFGVGQGDWSATDQIPAAIRVEFTVKARSLPAK